LLIKHFSPLIQILTYRLPINFYGTKQLQYAKSGQTTVNLFNEPSSYLRAFSILIITKILSGGDHA